MSLAITLAILLTGASPEQIRHEESVLSSEVHHAKQQVIQEEKELTIDNLKKHLHRDVKVHQALDTDKYLINYNNASVCFFEEQFHPAYLCST